MFYFVKITSVNYEHTCTLSTIHHHCAMQAGGRNVLDLKKMKFILNLLHIRPHMPTWELRPFIASPLPHHCGADSKLVCAFRACATKFLITHDILEELTQDVANQLVTSKPICAADEVINTDDPIVTKNLHQMFPTSMQESSSTWTCIDFLQKQSDENNGFVFKVKFSDKGHPQAVLWMTRKMHHDLIRFSDVLYLDAQQRQFNTAGWPYISLCMTNEERNVSQAAKCLCTKECLGNYAWILKTMSQLEPSFSLDSVKFICADQKITPHLLCMLSIEETCILHGNSWHLLNEVWPKPHNFGDRFHEVKHFLKSMLQCRTQNKWDAAYQGAWLLLANSPMRVDKLDIIPSNPKYCAGYYLTSIAEGSIRKQGDTPAEQNHSLVVAHIGKGGTFQIVEQCKSLLERQQTRTRLKLSSKNDLSMDIHCYKSKLSGPEGHADNDACKHLSWFAHRKFLDLETCCNTPTLCGCHG